MPTNRVGSVTPYEAFTVMSESDITSMARFASYLIKRNGCIEIRVFNNGDSGNIYGVGYFDDAKELVKQIYTEKPRFELKYDDVPKDSEATFFFTLNAISKNFLHIKNNRIGRAKTSVSDTDVTRLRHLLIDVDPVRNPTKISSTAEEKSHAKEVHDRVSEYLASKGMADVIKCDSGNGFHILIPVDYPVEDKSKTQKFLAILDQKFSTDKAKVDTSVVNPGRVCKLYHTWVIKGEHSSERPHRRSFIYSFPSALENGQI